MVMNGYFSIRDEMLVYYYFFFLRLLFFLTLILTNRARIGPLPLLHVYLHVKNTCCEYLIFYGFLRKTETKV